MLSTITKWRRHALAVALLVLAPAPALAAGLVTWMLVGSAALSLFDSGSNVTALQIAQSHEMLRLMHRRLDAHADAFERVLDDLDRMPPELARELRYAEDDTYRRQLLGYLDRLAVDFEQLAQGGDPIPTPEDRLGELERHFDRTRTSREDLNLPYILLAMQAEKAIYYGFGRERTWEGTTPSGGVKSIYRRRIESMLDPTRERSLAASLKRVQREKAKQFAELEEELKNLSPHLVSPYVGVLGPEQCGNQVVDPWFREVREEESRQQTLELLKIRVAGHTAVMAIRMDETYQYMAHEARYALVLLSDAAGTRPQRTKMRDLNDHPTVWPELAPILTRAMAHQDQKIERAAQTAREHNQFLRNVAVRCGAPDIMVM